MPPVEAAVSQPGMPLRHSGHRACRHFSKSHNTMELTTDLLTRSPPPFLPTPEAAGFPVAIPVTLQSAATTHRYSTPAAVASRQEPIANPLSSRPLGVNVAMCLPDRRRRAPGDPFLSRCGARGRHGCAPRVSRGFQCPGVGLLERVPAVARRAAPRALHPQAGGPRFPPPGVGRRQLYSAKDQWTPQRGGLPCRGRGRIIKALTVAWVRASELSQGVGGAIMSPSPSSRQLAGRMFLASWR